MAAHNISSYCRPPVRGDTELVKASLINEIKVVYMKGVQYLIKGRECVKSTLQQKDKIGCVPANSTLMSHYWFGSMEKYGEHMFAKSYQIADQGLMGFLSVTEKDCALVSETVYGSVNAGT